ncbi:gamma-butyrobetaine hydroxylase-like domain-containing protein [Thalassotalea agarivorans]|uniref:DUF971 family protein n=1 Tax=Thalassotalea agarivorans TaxID=349064 RepID=A0A1I0H1S2_THASX|nr:gamma-butyrobetaine hydroxylase-like domain-containing protein [Thalassotalea agarivorans]SET77647.1 DUF971 family protein [Thalassotalea agarivorans]
MHINAFELCTATNSLTIKFDGQPACSLSAEFLRVMTPSDKEKNTPIGHKKTVAILAIESVAIHGFRIIFDDQHATIITADQLFSLSQRQQVLWQKYLSDIQQHGVSREALINFKSL